MVHYENVNERPIKVMARGLHHTCPVEDIRKELFERGFKIITAVNMIKKEKKTDKSGNAVVTKRGLPLFMLTFEKEQQVEEVFKINAILNMRVKIEALKKQSSLIPQCKRCQGFNHTQKYCNRQPKCVKCAESHGPNQCQLEESKKPICVNCSKNHPANFRGCEVAKELQKMRDKKRNVSIKTQNANSTRKLQGVTSEKTTKGKSYAQALTNESSQSVPQYILDITKALNSINKRLDAQDKWNEHINSKLEKLST